MNQRNNFFTTCKAAESDIYSPATSVWWIRNVCMCVCCSCAHWRLFSIRLDWMLKTMPTRGAYTLFTDKTQSHWYDIRKAQFNRCCHPFIQLSVHENAHQHTHTDIDTHTKIRTEPGCKWSFIIIAQPFVIACGMISCFGWAWQMCMPLLPCMGTLGVWQGVCVCVCVSYICDSTVRYRSWHTMG